MMQAEVSQLFIFPVKSLRGISVQEAVLTPLGLQWDRHWMIVKEDGHFITQRQHASMVLIKTALSEEHLILSKAGMDDLHIPLKSEAKTDPFTAKIWQDDCEVTDEGEEASLWLHAALVKESDNLKGKLKGKHKGKLRLVRMAANSKRPQSKPDLLGETTTTEFADAAPYLICNQSSLDQLNQSLTEINEQPVSMERFRPNIVITGLDAFCERNIHTLEHQHFTLEHRYPCQRCVIPTIDIERAERHPQQQPFRLLAKINSMPDNPKAPAFGENAILIEGENAYIRVGDTLSLSN